MLGWLTGREVLGQVLCVLLGEQVSRSMALLRFTCSQELLSPAELQGEGMCVRSALLLFQCPFLCLSL